MPRMLKARETWSEAQKAPDEALDVTLRGQIVTAWEQAKPLIKQANRLRARLADPALANHSKRPDAERRLALLEERINREMRTVQESWQLLSRLGCDVMTRDGWPDAAHGVEFAIALRRDIALGPPYRYAVNREA